MQEQTLKTVSDDDLLRDLSEILKTSRWTEADLVARIAEVDARRLWAREAAPSMFAYCTEILHLSEQEAYLRIAVGRASREHPMLLGMLRDGRLHLSGIARLAPHLTRENREFLLARAAHKSHRQIVGMVAELAPKPSVPATIRKLPAPRAMAPRASDGEPGADRGESPAPGPGSDRVETELCAHRVEGSGGGLRTAEVAALPVRAAAHAARASGRAAAIEPVAPARFRVRFDASAEFHDKLERLRALTRSTVPNGDLAKVIELAVTRELERLETRRFGKTKKPRRNLATANTRPKSRHIPAAVRRVVERRDGGRCTYRDKLGRRCTRRHDLEFHHDGTPFGKGGDHSPENVRLMCRAHNALLAEREYGKEKMARHSRSRSLVSKPKTVCTVGSPPSIAELRGAATFRSSAVTRAIESPRPTPGPCGAAGRSRSAAWARAPAAAR